MRLFPLYFSLMLLAGILAARETPRVFVFTDINIDAGDPDDRQSLVHLFWYADELEITGIVPDRWNAQGMEACQRVVDAYAQDYAEHNFSDKGYPSPERLSELLATDFTDAEARFIAAAEASTEPLYVLVWGNLRNVLRILDKRPDLAGQIRLITIGTGVKYGPQDDVPGEDCRQSNWNGPGRDALFDDPRFHEMWWLELNWTYNGMFTGPEPKEMFGKLSQFGSMGQHIQDVTKNEEWAQYFRVGDTPSVLYMVDPLHDRDDPTQSSWAGRFEKPFPEARPNYYTDASGDIEWNYADPCKTWHNRVALYDYCRSTLEAERPGMYAALLAKLEHVYTVRPAEDKYRVVIMTDMTHDDGNSLIRYLYYSPYFDTEAIIITNQLPDFTHEDTGPWDKGQSILQAYGEERERLLRYDPDYPSLESLQAITHPGRGALPIIWLTNEKKFSNTIAGRSVETTWGDIDFDDWIGEGENPNGEPKDSPGSEYLQEVFAKDDDRPIYVQMWGGSITFVQALYRYRQRQGEEAFQELLDKLNIYGILMQDITFDYFIDLDVARTLGCGNWGDVSSTYEGERVTPRWFLHDGSHFWWYCCFGPGEYIKPMLPIEVNAHGPMSNLYDHGGEGDTPAFLYLLSGRLGLNDPRDPTQGSWGTRFSPMGAEFPPGYMHTCDVPQSELLRWLTPVKQSFVNRLRYSLLEPKDVNREPIPILNADRSFLPMEMSARAGTSIVLDAGNSIDPDGDALRFKWWHYVEASEYQEAVDIEAAGPGLVKVHLPEDSGNRSIHIILEVHDSGSPSLTAYRRVILTATP